MKQKRIRLSFKRVFIFIILPIALAILGIYFLVFDKSAINQYVSNYSANENTINYDIIKLDNNPNYSGIRSKTC